MANLFELPRYIAVEGPIRVGKSTLARILGERLNAQRVMEAEDNPFLRAFYEGEQGAGFQAQFAFERVSVRAWPRALVKIVEPEFEFGIGFSEFVKDYLAGLNPAAGAQVEPAGYWIQSY